MCFFFTKRIGKRGVEIEKLHELLDQQQRLALQDKKLLEEYKAENDRLKVLKMPSQETEFKHLDNQYKDEENALKEKLENLQEQIKDQKRIEEQENQGNGGDYGNEGNQMSHSEQMIENQFIQILSEKENQWTYRPDLKSEEALWQNFRSHLNRINLAVLGEQPLTDKEFKQVKVEFSRLTGTPFSFSMA